MEISIVIVNWNGGGMLADCLRSAAAATGDLPSEIWLVDNASTDGSIERGLETCFGSRDLARERSPHSPTVHVMQNHENLGFARAANQALEKATGNFLLLLNPDVQLGATALSLMLAAMRSDARIGLAGCPSVDQAGRLSPGCEMSYPGLRRKVVCEGASSSLFKSASEERWESGQMANHSEILDVAWVSGACMMARREMRDEVGLLDPGFFMYYEDVDWCYRARAAGWRVVAVRGAVVKHELGGSSTLVAPAETARRAALSRLRFYRKHYPRGRVAWLTLGTLASQYWRILRRPALALFGAHAGRRQRNS